MFTFICRALIAIGSAVVPLAVRGDWTREWRAELWYATEARTAPASLVFRCAGALVHALWLRKEEWSLTIVLQDVRYALRAFRFRPGFAAVAILTLAVGIGANTAVFSVVHGVLLKPLPYEDPDRLVQIWEINPARNWTHEVVAPANFLDWKSRSRSFSAMAYYIGSDTRVPGLADVTLTGGGDPERLRAMTVSSNFFTVLGSSPALGRTFQADENLTGRVAVLSDPFWRRRFGADPTIVGRTVDLNGVPTEVVGIMPRAFTVPGAPADVWLPHIPDVKQFPAMRRPHWLRVIARLAPGVSLAAARDELSRIASDLEREYPETNTQMAVGAGPLHEWFVGDTRKALLALMGAVGLVLLVACLNVASLLLARATGRRQEIAVRVALGAGRTRLVRQGLTEGLVLAACGALGGILLAFGALVTLARIGPTTVPRLDQVAIDGTVLGVVVATICVTTLFFGVIPAWQSARDGSNDTMRQGSRGTANTTAGRRVLIVAEVALSMVLLVGAGLLLRSFERLARVDPGIDRGHALSFRISVPSRRYNTDAKVASFFTDAVDRLRTIPGVRAAGASVRLALEGRSWTGDLFIDGRPDVWGRELRHKAVTPGYFEAAGIRLVRGRDFSSADLTSRAPVAIVNQALARLYLADVDPLGQRIAFARGSTATTWRTIIGVVADEKQDGLAAEVKAEVYDPHTDDAPNTMSIVVRTAADPWSAVAAVRREVAALDPSVAIYDLRTLQEVVDRSLAEQRFTMLTLGAFAGVALILATVGLYGVIAFTVGQRRREIGVRLALGARRADVLGMVVWDGVRLVLIGLAIGAFSAVIVSRSLAGFLFEISPADPIVLMAVAALLGLAGALASYVPARRASLIDPALSLRAE